VTKVRRGEAVAEAAIERGPRVPPGGAGEAAVSGGGQPGEGGAPAESGRVSSCRIDPAAQADAATLGLSALAGVLAGAQDGITVIDAGRRFVYANPAACEMLGYPFEQLRGRDFLGSIPACEHAILLR